MNDDARRRLLVIGPERKDGENGPLRTDRDNALIAANSLRAAFVYDSTAEGHAFWKEVERRIREIADKELN